MENQGKEKKCVASQNKYLAEDVTLPTWVRPNKIMGQRTEREKG